MKKMRRTILLSMIAVVFCFSAIYAGRTYPEVSVESVTFSTIDYDVDRQQLSFLADDGKTYYFKHEGNAERIIIAKTYMAMLLSAKATGAQVKIIADDAETNYAGNTNYRIIRTITVLKN